MDAEFGCYNNRPFRRNDCDICGNHGASCNCFWCGRSRSLPYVPNEIKSENLQDDNTNQDHLDTSSK